MYEAHQVRSKSRFAVRRREEDVEEEEIQSGEINLIPYLDIVTNLMLFLLASVSAGILLGQLNTMLPDRAPSGASATDSKPDTPPDEQPLKLVVSVTKEQIILWSVSGREGTLKEPKAVIPRVGLDGTDCDGPYMCESGNCKLEGTKGVCRPNADASVPRLPVFDYRKLNAELYNIAKTHYLGKKRAMDTYQAVLMADDTTPYETLIAVMSAMRCKMPPLGESSERCFLPTADEEHVKPENPAIDEDNRLYDTARVEYDPDTQALFNDILFSRGFE
ncbi:MAG: biopolymer transporter ExbD [Kofleriaceae bacterium]|nr:biopolymer transporter ExbD [Myxococcales bacterium]MCB9563874.1 biopolymer transporter ExbD [Kofleriaceae bacterium]MCB9575092.1 biopolymer transporter ExbD [Kofleriaceae bacterium]